VEERGGSGRLLGGRRGEEVWESEGRSIVGERGQLWLGRGDGSVRRGLEDGQR